MSGPAEWTRSNRHTGLRLAELVGLDLPDLNLSDRTVRVRGGQLTATDIEPAEIAGLVDEIPA